MPRSRAPSPTLGGLSSKLQADFVRRERRHGVRPSIFSCGFTLASRMLVVYLEVHAASAAAGKRRM